MGFISVCSGAQEGVFITGCSYPDTFDTHKGIPDKRNSPHTSPPPFKRCHHETAPLYHNNLQQYSCRPSVLPFKPAEAPIYIYRAFSQQSSHTQIYTKWHHLLNTCTRTLLVFKSVKIIKLPDKCIWVPDIQGSTAYTNFVFWWFKVLKKAWNLQYCI